MTDDQIIEANANEIRRLHGVCREYRNTIDELIKMMKHAVPALEKAPLREMAKNKDDDNELILEEGMEFIRNFKQKIEELSD